MRLTKSLATVALPLAGFAVFVLFLMELSSKEIAVISSNDDTAADGEHGSVVAMVSASGVQSASAEPSGETADKKLNRKPFETVALRTVVDNEDKYSIGFVIGYGAFGVVYKVTRKSDKKEFACKYCNSTQSLDSELRALKFLESNKFHNVVSIEEVTKLRHRTVIIMELLQGGEVFRRIESTGSFSERDAAMVMKDLAQALADLANANIIHRDVKTENLVYVHDSQTSHVKLIDFGLAVQVDDASKSRRIGSRPEGSVMYMAPETLNHCWYSCKTDIWSAGIALYVLLVADNPYEIQDRVTRNNQILTGTYNTLDADLWSHITVEAKELVRWMLKFDPDERPTAEQVLGHKWILANTDDDNNAVASPAAAPVTKPSFSTDYISRVRNKLARERLRRAILCVRWTCGVQLLRRRAAAALQTQDDVDVITDNNDNNNDDDKTDLPDVCASSVSSADSTISDDTATNGRAVAHELPTSVTMKRTLEPPAEGADGALMKVARIAASTDTTDVCSENADSFDSISEDNNGNEDKDSDTNNNSNNDNSSNNNIETVASISVSSNGSVASCCLS